MDQTFDQEKVSWILLRKTIVREAKKLPPLGGKFDFSDALILSMYFWSVWHNQSLSWACCKAHYGRLFRPRKLPSISQFSRRIKSDRSQLLLQRIHIALAGFNSPLEAGYFDGLPLVVGAASKDPDAKRGHVSGGFAKGYKLHVLVTRRRRILLWAVSGLNLAEQSVAMELCSHLPMMLPDGLCMADSNYDSAPLHKRINERDSVLLTPLKGQKRRKNAKHHPVTLRKMGPGRREAVLLWQNHPHLARYILKERNNVEGTFSVLKTALNLHLPAWVRRLQRVRRWIGAKIILYHARLLAQEQAQTLAA